MKRDDPALCEPPAAELTPEASTVSPLHVVQREATYFGEGGTLFGWHHRAPDAAPRDAVAVLCAPFGPEYTRAHRSLRHLADRLARRGIPTLRFDYYSVGNSAGTEADAGLFERWRASVVQAAAEARRASGRTRLCLVGLRLGGTLATLAAEEAGAEIVATWNAVAKGRSYARELQAMAATAKDASDGGDGLESAGFRIHEQTLASIRAVDLDLAATPPGTRAMHWKRDDLPGWDGLLADHQFTVVPETALNTIADWIAANVPAGEAPPAAAFATRDELALDGVRERLCRFGPDRHLFGILSEPSHPGLGRPHAGVGSGRGPLSPATVVLLNAGSIHNVGPHRLYVRLARELALRGHPVLRLDLEGIGDSVLRGPSLASGDRARPAPPATCPEVPGRENHPYSPTAMRDLDAALGYLRRDHGCERFVVMGLCSGAYNTFQAGLHAADAGIERLVMVNPWYFHWREGLSLDTTIPNHYEDVAAYQRSMRDPERWKRLLRGEADLGRLARVALAHAAKLARGRWEDLKEMLVPSLGTRLSQDVRAICARGRRMHVILSDGEPAAAILDTEAKRAVGRAKRRGLFTLDRIPGGDHTFSRSAARDALVARIVELLQPPLVVQPRLSFVPFDAAHGLPGEGKGNRGCTRMHADKGKTDEGSFTYVADAARNS